VGGAIVFARTALAWAEPQRGWAIADLAAGRFPAARLVQQPARVEELRGSGIDRRDPHDHWVSVDVARDRPGVGDGHDGTTTLHSLAAERISARENGGLFRGGHPLSVALYRLRRLHLSSAPARKFPAAGVHQLPVSVRDAILGNLSFSGIENTTGS